MWLPSLNFVLKTGLDVAFHSYTRTDLDYWRFCQVRSHSHTQANSFSAVLSINYYDSLLWQTWLDCLHQSGCWYQRTIILLFWTSLPRMAQAADAREHASCFCSLGSKGRGHAHSISPYNSPTHHHITHDLLSEYIYNMSVFVKVNQSNYDNGNTADLTCKNILHKQHMLADVLPVLQQIARMPLKSPLSWVPLNWVEICADDFTTQHLSELNLTWEWVGFVFSLSVLKLSS